MSPLKSGTQQGTLPQVLFDAALHVLARALRQGDKRDTDRKESLVSLFTDDNFIRV